MELSPNERLRAWEELEQNSAWKELMQAVCDQREARERIILREVITPENIYDRERIRGEWAGLELVVEYAATLKEVAQQDVDNLAKENEDVDQA
jgi:hypothetical protein